MKTAELIDKSISGIREYGAGWMWDVSGINMHNKRVTITCRTGRDGEGIWECYENGSESQIVGRSQFKASRSKSAASRQVRQFHVRADEPVYA